MLDTYVGQELRHFGVIAGLGKTRKENSALRKL